MADDDGSGDFVVAATGVKRHFTNMWFVELSNRRNANNIKVKCFIWKEMRERKNLKNKIKSKTRFISVRLKLDY